MQSAHPLAGPAERPRGGLRVGDHLDPLPALKRLQQEEGPSRIEDIADMLVPDSYR